jgi:hypothetical protein
LGAKNKAEGLGAYQGTAITTVNIASNGPSASTSGNILPIATSHEHFVHGQ